MPQDAFTLKYIAKELNNMLIGGKINKIVQPNTDSVIFTIYKGKIYRLFVSADPSSPRINLLDSEQEAPLTAPNFCMLLRKHLSMATIQKIELVGFDRIVKITLSCSQEFFDAKEKILYVELMGRYSNVILTEDGKVLGANRGVNVFDNGIRPLIVNKQYTLPPKGDKKEPDNDLLIDIFNEFFNTKSTNLGEFIFANVLGLAQSTANEIAYQFTTINAKKNLQNSGKELFDFINDFIENTKANPCLVKVGETIKDVLVFDYLTIKGEREFFDSVCTADNEYFSKKSYQKNISAKRDRLNSIVSNQIKKIKKRLGAVLSRKKDAENLEENKLKGELILANVYLIKKGDKTLVANNYYDGSTIEISLNPDISPSQNANNYYKKYNKQKRSLTALESQEKIAQEELDYLTNVSEEIALCETIKDLAFIEEEIKAYGLIKDNAPKGKKKEDQKPKLYVINGYEVLAGRNNIENDKITFSAKPNDVWLHAKLYHSSHVVIKNPADKVVPDSVIKISAEICGYYSKAREGGNTEIVYTKKRYVKKIPKSKPGACIYTDFSSLVVKPEKHDEFLKK